MKKLLLPLCCGALTLLSALNCGPSLDAQDSDLGSVGAEALAKPAPAGCAVDAQTGGCANGGAACTKGDGTAGKCATTTLGCACK